MKFARLIGGVCVLILALFALGSMSCGQIAEPEIHLIPAGYMGNVYIFHNVPDGEPLVYEGRARVYKIPKDGILRSQGPLNEGRILSSQQYFYVTPDGKREAITDIGLRVFMTQRKTVPTRQSASSSHEWAVV